MVAVHDAPSYNPMSRTVSAAVLRAPSADFVIEEVSLDAPRADEVLVRLVATGICHTDLAFRGIVPLPAVLGHEGAGIVEAVGAHVTKTKPGDHVVLTFGSCGACRGCVSGRPHLCEDNLKLQFACQRADGSPTMTQNGDAVGGAFFQQSSFASHALATERNTVVVPDEAPLEILGPLGCGIQTGAGAVLNSFDMRAGASFAVFGAGAVGLSAVMAAVLAGAGPIIATDINAERLALALELGATHTIDAATGDVAGQIQTITGGGADFALETSSDEQAFHDLLECLALGGTCGVVATPRRGQPFPFSSRNLLVRAPTVMGILQGSSVPELFIPRLVELQRSGRFPIERLVTFYEFADINVAVADAEAGRAIKPILRIS